MPSRRDFLGALVGSAVLGACKGSQDRPDKAAPAQAAPPKVPPKAKPKQPPPAGAHSLQDAIRRERVRPPVSVARADTLTGIKRVKPPGADLVVGYSENPAKVLRTAVAAIGGIKLIVHPGATVVLTPNFALARPVSAGATTSPDVVREVIKLCHEAGAAEIICLDHTYHPTPRAFRVNGAYSAIAGTKARLLSPWSAEQYVVINDFHKGKLHREKLAWQAVPSVLLRADVLINMPVFKHHRDAGITGSVKKLMGCVWRRTAYHETGLQDCIAELGSIIRPTLTVMDATRFLSTNGPDGPGRVVHKNRVLVSLDHVLADAYACRWLGLKPQDVPYLMGAAKLGAGSVDVERAKIERVGG